jgi:quercetin dioxygenase-like cupin family protein
MEKKYTGTIHKFDGDLNKLFHWSGARSRGYESAAAKGVTETWLIGKPEKAQNFAMRYYSVEKGGFTVEEEHEHDHGIFIMQGEATVLMGDEKFDVSKGDVVYIPPNIRHQLVNRGQGAMGFICVIPAHRKKAGKDVWADENIKFNQE